MIPSKFLHLSKSSRKLPTIRHFLTAKSHFDAAAEIAARAETAINKLPPTTVGGFAFCIATVKVMQYMATTLHAAEVVGLTGKIIDVEIDLSPGLFSFSIVGLADKAIAESKERVSAAIKSFGARSPQKKNQRVIISLAPADLKKEGPVFDLAIALAYLSASKQLQFDPAGKLFLGELALGGALRPVKGVLALATAAKRAGVSEIFVPKGNGTEAALIEDIRVYEATSLGDVAEHLEGKVLIPVHPKTVIRPEKNAYAVDFADVKGQESAKRGLEIAAAGGHNAGMTGPPGTGKN